MTDSFRTELRRLEQRLPTLRGAAAHATVETLRHVAERLVAELDRAFDGTTVRLPQVRESDGPVGAPRIVDVIGAVAFEVERSGGDLAPFAAQLAAVRRSVGSTAGAHGAEQGQAAELQ